MVRQANRLQMAIFATNEDPALQDTYVSHPKQAGRKRTRSVRFQPSVKCMEFDAQDVQRNEIWYTAEAMKQFREKHTVNAKKVAKEAKSVENMSVLHLMEICKNDTDSRIPSQMHKALHKFTKKATNTGLETFATRQVFREKTVRRQAIWRAVAENKHCGDENIRHACEQISSASVMFAQTIAQA